MASASQPASTTTAVLVRPYLTEKSARLAELGQYTFVVTARAEKVDIARAIAARYGVHPTQVTTVHLPGKTVRTGATQGRRSGIRKAIISVRPGEKIPFGAKT
ncbi:50S ribosomal protein L23 [Candidatus Uhrbacteria bacterium]|nr:50S ribosomal protein L23 [Candidatus Uhrbacteria bacterium]